jgi:hypothetical protein
VLAVTLIACVEDPVGSLDWHGAYRWGHEVNSLCPCGTGKCYWVRADTGTRVQLRSYVEQHTRAPYQPVYLRMRGRLLDEPRQGFARDYDGLIRVEQLISLQETVPVRCEDR